MRSKDGGMTNFEWEIPIYDEGNLVLYANTFASSLEPTKLGKCGSFVTGSDKN